MDEMTIRGAGKTYYNWQKKVFEAMAEEQQGGPRFAEVRFQQPESSVAATVRIGPAVVDVYTGADAETVAAIAKALMVCRATSTVHAPCT